MDTLLPVIKGLDDGPLLGGSDDERSATSMRIMLGQALVNLGQASQARKQISILRKIGTEFACAGATNVEGLL